MVATHKSSRVVVNTTINGEETEFICEPRQSLLEVLRDVVGLTGTKEGCNDGNCGACSVTMDGRVVNSCLVLGVEAEGAKIGTVEGIATPAGLHPLQTAFLEQAALQCGICTPGFLVAAKALLEKEANPTEERIRFWLAGNLCRCTGYDKIVRAVMQASQMMQKSPSGAAQVAAAKSNGHARTNGRAKTAKTNGRA
jgi:carbon-monoxide dehydrogenase small subunit